MLLKPFSVDSVNGRAFTIEPKRLRSPVTAGPKISSSAPSLYLFNSVTSFCPEINSGPPRSTSTTRNRSCPGVVWAAWRRFLKTSSCSAAQACTPSSVASSTPSCTPCLRMSGDPMPTDTRSAFTSSGVALRSRSGILEPLSASPRSLLTKRFSSAPNISAAYRIASPPRALATSLPTPPPASRKMFSSALRAS